MEKIVKFLANAKNEVIVFKTSVVLNLLFIFVLPFIPATVIWWAWKNISVYYEYITLFSYVITAATFMGILYASDKRLTEMQVSTSFLWEYLLVKYLVRGYYDELLVALEILEPPHWKKQPWKSWASSNKELTLRVNAGLAALAKKFHEVPEKEKGSLKDRFWKAFHLARLLGLSTLPAGSALSHYAVWGIVAAETDEKNIAVFWGIKSLSVFEGVESLSDLFSVSYGNDRRLLDKYMLRLHNHFVNECNSLLAGFDGTLLVALAFLKHRKLLATTTSELADEQLKRIQKAYDAHNGFVKLLKRVKMPSGDNLFQVFKYNKPSYWVKTLEQQLDGEIISDTIAKFFPSNSRDLRIEKCEKSKNWKRLWFTRHDCSVIPGFPGRKMISTLYDKPDKVDDLLYKCLYGRSQGVKEVLS